MHVSADKDLMEEGNLGKLQIILEDIRLAIKQHAANPENPKRNKELYGHLPEMGWSLVKDAVKKPEGSSAYLRGEIMRLRNGIRRHMENGKDEELHSLVKPRKLPFDRKEFA